MQPYSPAASRVSLNGKVLNVVAEAFIGAVDATALTKNGASFRCWALTNPDRSEKVQLPAQFLFVARDQAVGAFAPNADRADLARKFGPSTLHCGLDVDLDLELLPRPLLPRLDVYAYDGDQTVSQLRFTSANDHLAQVTIATGADFFRLIQTPSTRLKDSTTLVYASMHILRRFPDEFAIRAAAICVIGYRLLEGTVIDNEIAELFEGESTRLLKLTPDLARGLFLRWHTSLRLIAGYYSYRKGDKTSARRHFDAIPKFAVDLEYWPQALTNILLGVYISGFLAFEPEHADAAIERWESAEGILRHGAAVSQFKNYYAYGELVNAVQVARECRIAAMVARNGGPLHDVSVAPDGLGLDPRTVPGPIGTLEAQYRAVTGEDDLIAKFRGIRPQH